MQELSLITGIAGILILLANSLGYSLRQFGSDHFFHLNLINLIKENKHRLVKKYKNLAGSKTIAYPQLFHWLFSFLPLKNISKTIFFYKSIIYFLDIIFFFLFFYTDLVAFTSVMPLWKIFLYAALLLIFTPFNYVRWNASNSGLSPRSLGVLLGRLFVYAFLVYINTKHWVAYLALILLALLVFMASQFALQYILFLCIFYAAFTVNVLILLVPAAGFLLFFLINKEVAVKFIKGQWQHKKTYSVYLAKRFILKARPGIWRDFVFDFWKKMYTDKLNAIPYIQYNAVVSIFWGFTILPAILYYFCQTGAYSSIQNFTAAAAQYPLLGMVLVTLLIFIITSFAVTRFLGEPERYLEFASPVMVVLFMQCFSSTVIYYTILYYVATSFILLLINRWYSKKTPVTKNPVWQFSGNSEIKNILEKLKEEKGVLRIFSNNEEVSRMLLDKEYEFLIPDIASEKTGPFFYKDFFPEQYPQVNPAIIIPAVKEFHINVFIAEKNRIDFRKFPGINLSCITCWENEQFELLYIEHGKS